MVADEKVQITFEAVGSASLAKAETALRRNAKALTEHEKELRKEITALKGAEAPNKQRISTLTKQAQELRANSAAIRSRIAALREEEAAARKAASGSREFGSAFPRINSLLASFRGGLVAGAVALAALPLLKTADEFKTLQNRLKDATRATGDFQKVSRELGLISVETGTALEGNVDIFQRLAFSAGQLGKTNEDILKLTRTVGQLGVIGGSSGEALKAGLLQFGQALGAGVVRAEEFNSVLENLPALAQAIADGLGISVAEVKKLVLDGKLLSKDVFAVLEKQAGSIQKRFEELEATPSRGFAAIKTSAEVLIGTLFDLLGITTGVGTALNSVAKTFTALTDAINKGAKSIKLVSSLFWDMVRSLGESILSLGKLAAAILGVDGDFQRLSSTLGLSNNLLKDMAVYLAEVGNWFDNFSARAQIAGNEVNRFKETIGNLFKAGGNTVKFAGLQEATDQKFDAKNAYIQLGVLEKYRQRAKAVYGQVDIASGGSRKKTTSPPPPGDKKKTKDKTASIEQKRISRILDNSRSRLSTLDVESDFAAANLGPFATQADISANKLQKLKAEASILRSTITEINSAQAKTEEGKEARANALKDLDLALKRNAVQTKDLSNETERFTNELQRNIQGLQDQRDNILSQADLERFKQQIEANSEALADQFERGLIPAQVYYKQLDTLAYEAYTAENELIEEQLSQLKFKRDSLKANEIEAGKQLEIQNEILALEERQKDISIDYGKQLRENVRNLAKLKESFAKNLAEGVSRSLEDAITGVFTGNGVLNSLKQFAQSIRQVFAQEFARSIVERFSGLITKITKPIGDALFNISQGNGVFSSLGGLFKSLSSLKGSKFLGTAGIGASLFGGFQVGKSSSLLGGALTGGIGGALSGAMFGPVGALVGGLAGLGSGIFGGLFGNKSRKKQEKEQKKLARVQSRLSQLLAGIDENNLNLNDLIPRAQAINKLKSGGGNAFRAKRAALEEVQRLIALRQKQISDAILQLQEDNKGLQDSLDLAQAEPFKRAALEKQQQLAALTRDTQKLLDQFKDSEAAKTEILANEALKRKLIEEDIQAEFKQTAESLADLFKQRDEISNSDVFTRAKTRTQQKQEAIQGLDKQISETLLSLGQFSQFGVATPNVEGINRYLNTSRLAQQNNNIQVVINGATDPNAVSEEVQRAITEFYRRYGFGEVA